MQFGDVFVGEVVQHVSEVRAGTEVEQPLCVADNQAVVMVAGTIDPQNLPVETLLPFRGELPRRQVIQRRRDELLVVEARPEVDAHVDSARHATQRSVVAVHRTERPERARMRARPTAR